VLEAVLARTTTVPAPVKFKIFPPLIFAKLPPLTIEKVTDKEEGEVDALRVALVPDITEEEGLKLIVGVALFMVTVAVVLLSVYPEIV
jgi:hypothetical protein